MGGSQLCAGDTAQHTAVEAKSTSGSSQQWWVHIWQQLYVEDGASSTGKQL